MRLQMLRCSQHTSHIQVGSFQVGSFHTVPIRLLWAPCCTPYGGGMGAETSANCPLAIGFDRILYRFQDVLNLLAKMHPKQTPLPAFVQGLLGLFSIVVGVS